MLIVLGLGASVTQSGKEAELWQVVCSTHILILTMENQCWKIWVEVWFEAMWIYRLHCFSLAACFDSGPRIMDSSEKQPLKWHYFRSVHENCVATQLLPRKWDSSVTEHQCRAWWCQAGPAEWNPSWQQPMIDMSQPGNEAVHNRIAHSQGWREVHTCHACREMHDRGWWCAILTRTTA